jgi:hypothetical protein
MPVNVDKNASFRAVWNIVSHAGAINADEATALSKTVERTSGARTLSNLECRHACEPHGGGRDQQQVGLVGTPWADVALMRWHIRSPPRADVVRPPLHARKVPTCMARPHCQDGLPRATNVRAASMYQASAVEH